MSNHLLLLAITIACATHHTASQALPLIPEGLRNAASIAFTTINQGPKKTKQELLAGSIPTSTRHLPATFAAALATTLLTNTIFRSTRAYRVLDKAAARCTRRLTRLPSWANKRVMPALSLAASTAFSMGCFMALHAPARIIEDELEELTDIHG